MDFHTYSNEYKRCNQKQKDKPKYKSKKPKKKKNPYLYRGRIIPSRKERTEITETDYYRMIEEFGSYCMMCGHTPIEAHHIIFREDFGSGNWRNLAPLCEKCHKHAHKQIEFAELIKEMRAERFGHHFGKDIYSLFMEGLVNNTTQESYERFMRLEEERCKNGL